MNERIEMRKTIAIDFDGVLHAYTTPWTKPEEIHDEPVPGAVEWVTEACSRFEVVVYSVRAETVPGREAMKAWLIRNGFPRDVLVMHEKPKAIVYIDDRAWRFEGTFPSLDDVAAFKPWNR